MFTVNRIALLWIIFGYALLAGCSSRDVTESDIVGIWVEKQGADVSSHTIDCAVFEFREDGTFKADNFPREAALCSVSTSEK